MNIEEKAKAYDEAIKRVENIKTGKCKTTFMFTEGLFEHIFPQLKESEDERVRKEIIAFITTTPKARNSHKKWIDWLEKRGEKETNGNEREIPNSEQKPAWSEEDEKMLKMAIKSCEQCGNGYAYYWLKSLKERYTWKPSDEQMGALNYVVNLMASSESLKENTYYYNVFKHLREQLKKLREE